MAAAKVYVTRPVFDEALERLRGAVAVEINPVDRVLSPAELKSKLHGVDGAITFLTDVIDGNLLYEEPLLKVIANFAVGFNNVDVDAATRLGVIVTNTPGVLTETTADFAWTLLMAAARRVVEADAFTRAGKFDMWRPKMFLGHDVHGKTLGIIGLGRIGQAVARRAAGFHMNIRFHDTEPISDAVITELGVDWLSLDDLLRTADFITVHVPLAPQTTHLLNDRAFALMKPSCIVVNTSRGPVIDEKALVRALQQGKIAAAGLDVYENEPAIEPELMAMNNVVLAPHIASASHETRLKMCMMAVDNLLAALRGERPPNLVNPAVWNQRRS